MANKHILEELNNLSREELITTVLMMQGQLSFLDEAETAYDEFVPEPIPEEVLPSKQSRKKKGQRNLDFKDSP
ncbi:MAG: hypothetical protein ACI4GD_08545 [Lachnospiraceae bacterium]